MPEKLLTAIPRPLREQYEKGLAAIQRQNLDYAIAIFDQVMQKEPGFYACREALRAAQAKRAGKKGGFLKKMFGAATSSPLRRRASSPCAPTRPKRSISPNKCSTATRITSP